MDLLRRKCCGFIFVIFLNYSLFCVSDSRSDEETKIEPKTYIQTLNDASMNIQNANNATHQKIHQNFLEGVRDFQIPVQNFIDKKRSKERYFKDNTTYHEMRYLKEPEILTQLLNTLQTLSQNDSSTCINDTALLLVGIIEGNPSVIPFFDAMGKPGSSLTQGRFNLVGNYYQCRASKYVSNGTNQSNDTFGGNYCVINAGIPSVGGIPISIGTCLPDTCSSGEVTILAREIARILGLDKKLPAQFIVGECRTAPTETTTASVFAIIILCIVVFMMFIGTSFDLWTHKMTDSVLIDSAPEINNHNSSNQNENNGVSNSSNMTPPPAKSGTSSTLSLMHTESEKHKVLAQVLLAFSVYSNSKKILNSSQASGSLGAIHGIRFISMSWVVLCHIFLMSIGSTLNASTEIPDFVNRWTFLPIINGFFSVDTFFTLSGLLTSYLTIKEMSRRKSWKINWPMFYFHRFWRLTPPYMLSIVIFLGLTQYMGQGPLWANTQPNDRKNCEENWWTNLLYINNIAKTKGLCFGHSWYLANDMQFFVLSPLMLIPFHLHRFAGLASCLIFIIIHMITTGSLSSIHNWPTTMVSLHPIPGRASQTIWFLDYYFKPWTRIGPFIVGVIAGYILTLSKGRPFKMPLWVVATGWTLSVASGLAIVYGLRGEVTGDHPSSIPVAALYNAVSRTLWGVCICWVIIACSAGYGGPVNSLLSWSPFVVLGRLTYMTYLIHLPLVQIFFTSMSALVYIDAKMYAILFLGILLFVNMVSFLAVLGLESPMLGLEKVFIIWKEKS